MLGVIRGLDSTYKTVLPSDYGSPRQEPEDAAIKRAKSAVLTRCVALLSFTIVRQLHLHRATSVLCTLHTAV